MAKHAYCTERETSHRMAVVYDWISSAIAALVVVALVFALLFRVVSVDGASMTNTLQHGDRLLLSSVSYSPAYEDIVVITRTQDAPLIKRVIGLAGDRIRIDAATGIVYRNDAPLAEPYVRGGFTPNNGMTEELTVPEGHIFVLGDNRSDSLDSRILGPLSLENVVGKVMYRIAPNPGSVTIGE